MKTYLDCIPCFFRQALEISKILKVSKDKQKKIFDEIAKAVIKFSLNNPPPLMGKTIHNIVKKITKKEDPYSQIKRKSNHLALKIYPYLKKKVYHSSDRLQKAVELAIAGNIIDYGVGSDFGKESMKDIKKQISLNRINSKFFKYKEFKEALRKSRSILYLADNAGEVVFDKVLIEEIKSLYPDKEIIYAVREKPIINDALISDAYFCGIDKVAQVISSGCDAPGTVLSLCSQDFLKVYKKADMIISKGQGNFEALWGKRDCIFFLFMAKCPVVAKEVGSRVGEKILLFNAGS